MRLRAFRVSQSQIRGPQDAQRVGVVVLQRKHRLRVILCLLQGTLVAGGGHQFGQLQLRAGMPGIDLNGLLKVRRRGSAVVSR